MKQKILITGGSGFIASNFIEFLFQHKSESIELLVNIDCINYCSSLRKLDVDPTRYVFIKGNITSFDLVKLILEKYEIDTVIHFAAQSHVDNSFDSEKTLQYTIDNVLGTHTLLQVCKDYNKVKKFIHMSTDEVYGQVHKTHAGCSEFDLLNPTNPYAATKAGAEFLVRSYIHSYNLPCIVIRCNNVYGPHQYPEKLIPRFVKLIHENKKLTIHGSGDTRRNFIFVDDVSSAITCILDKGTLGNTYNIGTENEYSVLEIAEILLSFVDKKPIDGETIEFVEDRPFNDFRYAINSEKLRELGWTEENKTREKFVQRLKELFDSDSSFVKSS
jgi:dTDP-glucose 4,6-dehydratase